MEKKYTTSVWMSFNVSFFLFLTDVVLSSRILCSNELLEVFKLELCFGSFFCTIPLLDEMTTGFTIGLPSATEAMPFRKAKRKCQQVVSQKLASWKVLIHIYWQAERYWYKLSVRNQQAEKSWYTFISKLKMIPYQEWHQSAHQRWKVSPCLAQIFYGKQLFSYVQLSNCSTS